MVETNEIIIITVIYGNLEKVFDSIGLNIGLV